MPDPNRYTVGWICALPTELVAAKVFLDSEHKRSSYVAKHDSNSYLLGSMAGHNVVIAVLPAGEYGTTSAATVARDMVHSFPNIRFGLMVGVGGGAPSSQHDIRLGDVVVSMAREGEGAVFQYDYGKTMQEQAFRYTGFLNQPPTVIRTAINALKCEGAAGGYQLEEAINDVLLKRQILVPEFGRPDPSSDRLFRSDVVHPPVAGSCAQLCLDDPWKLVCRHERTAAESNPAVHYGIIASANQVMKDAMIRDKLVEQKNVLCFEMEAAGLMNHFPCLVIRGICDYSDSHKSKEWQGYAAMAAAAYAKALLQKIVPSQIEEVERIGKRLAQSLTRLKVHDGIARVDGKIDAITDSLSAESCVVGSAAFDSYDESHNSTCLPGTRVELIRQILDWASSDDGKPIFWLNGMLGTGKSTVSRTVAQSLCRAGRLGASFFFKRGHSDRQNAAKFFTTIADQLARMQPAMADPIKDAARTDPSIGSKGVEEQFNQLILRPLSALPKENWKGKQVVIVVDALDECGQEDDATEILRLLSLAEPWLRVFVTSRPELPIYQGFVNIEGQVQEVTCNAIPRSMIKQDIMLLITYRLDEIRDKFNRSKGRRAPLDQSWPRQDHIDTLAEMATPLFIYAAMMCNFIDEIRCGYPNSQLRKVLGWKAENSKTSPEPKLDEAYLLLLNQLLANLAKEGRDTFTFLEEFRGIVGSIVLLGSPLPMPVLAELLGLPFERVDITLNMLRSVLDVPPSDEDPVRPLHVSFRDFLVREAKKRHTFWIDEAKAHGAIAARCLHVMNQYFERDLQPSGAEVSMMDGEKADASNEVQAAAVRYACLHWVFHLQGAKGGGHDVYGDALLFLEKHFLHWLEVLSEMHQVPESIKMLKTLRALPHMKDDNGELSAFVGDALRILRANLQIIIDEPRQLYSSVILFAPDESIIKRLFMGSMRIQVFPKPKVESHWNHCMQTLEGHTESVLCVTFSHDSLRVASASEDHSVRLWSIETGETVILKGHSRPVYAVVFSHDSLHVASGAGDSTVRVWRTESGKCIHTLDSGGRQIESVAFSYNSTLIASVSRCGVISVWRATTANDGFVYVKEYESIKFDHFTVNCLAFTHSEQGEALHTALAEYTGSIKQLLSGHIIRTLDSHKGRVMCMAFSHDALLLASASDDWSVKLWKTQGGDLIQEYAGSPGVVTAIAFSHDASLVALASDDHTIRLHCTVTMECVQEFNNPGRQVTSVAFSHDSSTIASASQDHSIQLWQVDLVPGLGRHNKAAGAVINADATDIIDHTSHIVSVAFSQDGLFMASLSYGHTVQIWRTDTGECLRRFQGRTVSDVSQRQEPCPVNCLAFSHDSLYLAVSLQEETVTIWDVERGEHEQELGDHEGSVTSVTFSQDSKLLASTSGAWIRLWDFATGEGYLKLRSPPRPSGRRSRHREGLFNGVAFSHDSSLVVAASTTGLQLWRLDTKECVKIWGCRQVCFDSVAFSHDSTLVASASNGKIQLWRTGTWQCIQVFDTGNSISQLSFTCDDLSIVTNIGTFTRATNEGSFRVDGYGFTDGLSWITHKGDKRLWLPKDWRPTCSASPDLNSLATSPIPPSKYYDFKDIPVCWDNTKMSRPAEAVRTPIE
ncbi:WD40 repeat-like protein [Trichoderma gracile]